MSVEFRLGRNDHNKVEDFLASRPSGVSAITVDTAAVRHQAGAIEAARDAGVDVLFDPVTERLADRGFEIAGLEYTEGPPYDLANMTRDSRVRATLVEQVIGAHPEGATLITPPHFFVHDERSANLNLALAEDTRRQADRPVRATLLLARKFGLEAADRLAAEYIHAGISRLELRVTPLGGDDEGDAKIRSVYRLADVFTMAGLQVTLGYSGNIGQTAVALGHVNGYSVGIGLRETVNYSETISRQKNPPPPKEDGEGGRFGAVAGIYLPGPALTVGRKIGAALLANTDIRTRISCRLGTCGASVEGPARDPRGHYLHSRTTEMAALLARPAAWRATTEMDRLRRALELRELINERYLGTDVRPFKTRTLRSLINDIEVERAALSA